MEQKYYAVYHKDKSVLKNSSSGGAFTAISDAWFELHQDAVVYGCIMNNKLEAVHHRATNKSERDKMCGSKYIGSDMSGILHMIEEDLKKGFYVLFSGTPCQVAGLKAYIDAKKLSYNKEQLLTVEVICHGVGSTRFFKDYVAYLENKYRSKAKDCKFRAKNKPWQKQDMEIIFENEKKYNAPSTKHDWFYSVYLKNLILRPSCYKCKYACKNRNADISLADLWGIDDFSNKGRSLVILNTEIGVKWFENISEIAVIEEISEEDICQPNLKNPTAKPEFYDKFWDTYTKKGYKIVQRDFGNNTVNGKIEFSAAVFLNRMNLIPILKKVKRVLKK